MKFLLALLIPLTVLISCGGDYGNKVTINDKSDVFYKGKGVTESDAKRLGDYLLREGYFDTTTSKSVQLVKDSSAWVVRLVVDKEKYANADGTIAMSMIIFQQAMSEQVFNKEKTRLELVDDEMKPINISRHTPPVIVDDSATSNKN